MKSPRTVVAALCILLPALLGSPARGQGTLPQQDSFLPPSQLTALAYYDTSTIRLRWKDNTSAETGFAIERRVDGGPWTQIQIVGPATGGFVTHFDGPLATDSEYRYRVRALRGAATTQPSSEARQNFRLTWPVPASHELLHGWNDTIGSAGIGENNLAVGFHKGVDIQRQGIDNVAVAPRSGTVEAVVPGPNGYVAVKAWNAGAPFETHTLSHLDNVIVAPGQHVYAGQTVGRVAQNWFLSDFVDHVHYVLRDADGVLIAQNPLLIFSAVVDLDPGVVPPALAEHQTPADGSAYFRSQASGGPPSPVSATTPLSGDIDLIVEHGDRQGTNPDQVAMRLGYWVEPLETSGDGILFHGVASANSPYLLFDWATSYFGLGETSLALSQRIVDTTQNLQSGISQDGQPYPWPNYKHFVVTNASSFLGGPSGASTAEHWNTDALDDGAPGTVETANYAGLPDALVPTLARFPDGEYAVHVVASDLIHAAATSSFTVRLENFSPIVVHSDPVQDEVLAPGTTAYWATIRFSEAMDRAIPAAGLLSIDNGANLSGAAWTSDRELSVHIDGLAAGEFTLNVSSGALDLPGSPGHRPLDGNADGNGGDDHELRFRVSLGQVVLTEGQDVRSLMPNGTLQTLHSQPNAWEMPAVATNGINYYLGANLSSGSSFIVDGAELYSFAREAFIDIGANTRGDVYMAMTTNDVDVVYRHTPGGPSPVYLADQGHSITSIAVDGAGNLYIALVSGFGSCGSPCTTLLKNSVPSLQLPDYVYDIAATTGGIVYFCGEDSTFGSSSIKRWDGSSISTLYTAPQNTVIWSVAASSTGDFYYLHDGPLGTELSKNGVVLYSSASSMEDLAATSP